MVHLLLIILSLASFPPIFSNLAADRSALLRLQATVRGRTLLWNTTSSVTPCSWQGVKCDNTTNRVTALRLPGDSLRGQLPLNSIGNLTELRVLSLRGNSLFGEIPSDLASCTQLQDLHLQGNNFSGELPASLFTLRNLLRVNLAGNSFSGNLSSRFNNLTELKTLYLENNRFTGMLPDLHSLTGLRNFNVSFNGLTGHVPSSLAVFSPQSFLGTSLCGYTLVSCSDNNRNKLSTGEIAGIVVGSGVAMFLIVVVLFVSWRKCRSRKILPFRNPNPVLSLDQPNRPNPYAFSSKTQKNERLVMAINRSMSDELVVFGESVEILRLQDLLGSSAEVMGNGTIGSTYKAYLESGIEVIVKRLRNVRLSEEEFRCKIEELGSFVHQNLQPLRGYSYGIEKILLFDPLPLSLSALLHGEHNRPLSWETRARIATGIASGIDYLHSVSPKSTHGNIKSSNIFITDDYNALVSEFGLTELISPVFNLNGYRDPEVASTFRASQKADVYSFGVLLLELMTGKEPDNVLAVEGTELPNWVRSVDQEKWRDQVFGSDLLRCENFEEKLSRLLLLAMSCTNQLPDERPSMEEVVRRIKKICD